MTAHDPKIADVVRLRHRQAVDRRDELRLLRAVAAGMTQTEIARALRISQPAVHKALKAAEQVSGVPEGFSGGDPYEIAERYAVGQIDRNQVIDELARWPYADGASTDGFDWLVEEVPGTFEEVGRAFDEGLLDAETYDEILVRSSGR